MPVDPKRAAKDVSGLLLEVRNGNKAALDELMPCVYDELRRVAAFFLRQERSDHTLQPTALVNEAYLRLVNQRNVDWQNRAQFFGLAAQMMRRILVNYAKARRAGKRGANANKVPLEEATLVVADGKVNLLELNAALTSLAARDAEKSRIIELRFFGGLTMQEIAEVLGKSTATIEREWSLARAWLYREMRRK